MRIKKQNQETYLGFRFFSILNDKYLRSILRTKYIDDQSIGKIKK